MLWPDFLLVSLFSDSHFGDSDFDFGVFDFGFESWKKKPWCSFMNDWQIADSIKPWLYKPKPIWLEKLEPELWLNWWLGRSLPSNHPSSSGSLTSLKEMTPDIGHSVVHPYLVPTRHRDLDLSPARQIISRYSLKCSSNCFNKVWTGGHCKEQISKRVSRSYCIVGR